MRKTLVFILALICSWPLLAHKVLQQGSLNSPAITPITIGVAPSSVPLQLSTSQIFVATLTGDILNKGAVWTLTGAGCSGATCGTLSPSFNIAGSNQTISLSASSITYTAPPSLPSTPTVTLTATSVQDSTKIANATIVLSSNPPPVVPQTVSALTAQTAASTNTFPIGSTLGNGLVVGALLSGTTTLPSSVKSCLASNPATCVTLSLAGSSTNSTSNTILGVYTGLGIASGQGTIVTAEGSPTGTIAVSFADVTNAGTIDAITSKSNQSSTNPSGPVATPTISNDFAISFVATTGVVSAVTSPLGLSNGSAGFGFATSSVVLSNSSTLTPAYTATTGNWESNTLLLKPGTSSGAPISVSLTPTSAIVQTSGTQAFTCTVANDPANGGCTVTYTGTGCSGATCGTGPGTATSGTPFTYTAPASVPGSGGSAITRVQHTKVGVEAFPATIAITPTSGGSTDLLCEVVHWQTPETGTITGVTDSASQTYTSIVNGTHAASSSYDMRCTYPSAAGVTSITINSTSTARLIDVFAVEYKGISSITPDVTSSSTFNTAATTMDSGFTSATTNTADLLFGIIENYSANTFTAGNDGQGDNYTLLDTSNEVGSADEDFFPTTATNTYKATLTTDVAGNGFAAVVPFKGSAGGGAATPVTITATSVTNPTKSAMSVVTIQTAASPISVSIAPNGASVQVSGTQAFTPTILHDSAGTPTVNWTLTQAGGNCSPICGSISASSSATGVPVTYTAPTTAPSGSNVVLTGTDVTDNTKSASVTISIINPTGPFSCTLPNCPAFPGAQGAGAPSAGGRGGAVIEVTNLNDSGTGSLRACIQATGARTCVFRVAGHIPVLSRLAITNPFITIAGQTTPGGGIVLGGVNQAGEVIQVATHDVIVRYVTYDGNAGGPPFATGPAIGSVGLEIANCNPNTDPVTHNFGCWNVIFDHWSDRWYGNKSAFGFSNGPNQIAKTFTFQWGLMYEPNVAHPVAPSPDVDQGASQFAAVDNDYHHTLIANADHRCPLSAVRSIRWVNMVCFNTLQNTSSFNMGAWGALQVDVIGSKFLDGPQSVEPQYNIVIQPDPSSPIDPANCNPTCDNGPAQGRFPTLYLLNNTGHAGTNTGGPSIAITNVVNDAGEISMTAQTPHVEGPNNQTPMPGSWFRSTPLPTETYPIVADQVTNLDTVMTPTVGNSQRIDCNGNWQSNRDSQDARIIAQYLARGPGSMFAGPGYLGPLTAPSVSAGTACVESQHDGIPDQWKTAHGLSTASPINNNISPHTGLTILETYLSGLQP